jgi:hypothetical protein
MALPPNNNDKPSMGEAAHWVTRPMPWYTTDLLYCSTCGAMLHRCYWLAGPNGQSAYCSPDCEALEARIASLYASYAAGDAENRPGEPGRELT